MWEFTAVDIVSSRVIADRTQVFWEYARFGKTPIMSIEEMFSYMSKEIIRSTGRNLIAEWGRYMATGKAISLFEEADCDE